MKAPCLHCRQSRWIHDPNDYTLPVFASCKKDLQPGPRENECAGLELFQKSVRDLITDNIKKYHAKGRS